VGALHAVGLGGERHVGAVVDEEARAVAPRGGAKRARQAQEVADFQILLAELNAPEAGVEAGLDGLRQRPARLCSIGDEVEGEAGSAAQLVLQSGTPSMGDDAVA
jgi:hypothetical protein